MLRPINLWFGLLSLRSSKLRSALTMLGIIIGVAAVIVIVALGDALRRSTEKQMESWSSGLIEVNPNYMYAPAPITVDAMKGGGAMPMPMPGQQPHLDLEDVSALERVATSIDGVTGGFETYGSLVYQGKRAQQGGQIIGVTASFLSVNQKGLAGGRSLTAYDDATAAPVAVINELLAKGIFGVRVNPVGEVLHVTAGGLTQNVTIVGVIANPDETWDRTTMALVMPLRSVWLRFAQPGASGSVARTLSWISVRVDSRDQARRQFSLAEISTILRARRGIAPGAQDDFQVYDTLGNVDQQGQVLQTITLVLSLIAGISLVVGSIGLMNIMLVGVSERTPEIGLRRAMGARRGDVLGQFLTEAVLLALLGGLFGFGLGALGAQGISQLIEPLKGMVSVTPAIVGIALGVSVVVGVLAGLYPAWRAALLQPTDALRRG
jgi:putative ABC transport system permease protein